MEEELKCHVCKLLFTNPVLLPCYHSICFNCAIQIQRPITSNSTVNTPQLHNFQSNHAHSNHVVVTTVTVHHSPNSISSGIGESELSYNTDDSDKISILSETDSGVVVCNGTSRPVSYFGSANMKLLFSQTQSSVFSLSCPTCYKLVYLDETGAHNLPRYRIMANIVERYIETKSLGTKCQLCEKAARVATTMCEQCEIFYCDKCLESCHPARGPFATHSLLTPQQGKVRLKGNGTSAENQCPDHPSCLLSVFCIGCNLSLCIGCIQDRKHGDHELQPIQMMSKIQKTELSHNLQQLSEKAKSGTEFIQRLKAQTEKVNENSAEIEAVMTSQIDGIIEALQQRKAELITFIKREKEYKLRSLKTEVSSHTQRLQQTTSLVQFCIEALKDTDPTAFLQVGSMLLARVAHLDGAWASDDDSACSTDSSSIQTSPGSKPPSTISSSSSYTPSYFNPDFDLTLDDRGVLGAIQQLNFIQMKPPGAVTIIPEDCSVDNNSITIAWQPPSTSFVEGYVLEIDDGARGPFREVYFGKETICTVDGLHFDSLYNARIKAYNSTGDGEYSQVISLQTAGVAWFTFDQTLPLQGVRLSNGNCTVTSDSYEPRVVLGTVGFARGVHYWEYVVDRYDASADPSFGIARLDVTREEMLGKDDKGWGMYIDHQRSWFIHCGVHTSRTEGGIGHGSIIGIVLDLDKRQLTFYVNEQRQGPVAFKNLLGVFYPAVSINCNVSLTLRTAIELPAEYYNT